MEKNITWINSKLMQTNWPYKSRSFVAKIPPLKTPHRWKNCVTAIQIVREQTRSNCVTSELKIEWCSNELHFSVAANFPTIVCCCCQSNNASFRFSYTSQKSNSLFSLSGCAMFIHSVWLASGSPVSGCWQKYSPYFANGAVKMMQAMNQAAGILHKNIRNTVRRCHAPHSPITSKIELCVFRVCKLPLGVGHMICNVDWSRYEFQFTAKHLYDPKLYEENSKDLWWGTSFE